MHTTKEEITTQPTTLPQDDQHLLSEDGILRNFHPFPEECIQKLKAIEIGNSSNFFCPSTSLTQLWKLERRLNGRIPFFREHPHLSDEDSPPGQPCVDDICVMCGDDTATKTISYTFGRWRKLSSAARSSHHQIALATIRTHDDFKTILNAAAPFDRVFFVRGEPLTLRPFWHWYRRRLMDRYEDGSGIFIDVPRRWVSLDVDGLALPDELSYDDPDAIVKWVMTEKMPPVFRDVSCTWRVSSGGGTYDQRSVRFHFYLFLSEPAYTEDVYRLFRSDPDAYGLIDEKAYHTANVIYQADPKIDEKSAIKLDPLAGRRVGFFKGVHENADLAAALHTMQADEASAVRKREEKAKIKLDKAVATAKTHEEKRDLRTNGLPLRTDGKYEGMWSNIVKYELGLHNKRYYGPIFRLLITAVESGERDGTRLIKRVQETVMAAAAKYGDLVEYGPTIQSYLATDALRRRLDSIEAKLKLETGTDVTITYSNKGDA